MTLPNRKRLRLNGHDYSANGAYFVTICTHNREIMFRDITSMELNNNGCIVQSNIEKLNGLYDGITVEKYVVMPNHVHMIILICRERIVCVPHSDPTKSQLSKIIQIFKSSVTKEIRKVNRNACNAFPTEIWQSHFHDRIIRNEQEYQMIWTYIDENVLKWKYDCFYDGDK